MGRSPSSICREIARDGGKARYRALAADRQAWRNAERPKPCRLAQRPALALLVARKLRLNWSPQQIAAWLAREFGSDDSRRVSHETIYRTLFIQTRGVLKKELIAHLRRGRSMRYGRHYRGKLGSGGGQIANAVSIRERPAQAEDRAVPGHWEGDLLCGTPGTQIATLVERHSRFVMLVKLPSKDSPTVARALTRHVKTLPKHDRRNLRRYDNTAKNFKKTLVYDNGISPLGLPRSCMDFALKDKAKLSGVFGALRDKFQVKGGRDVLAKVQRVNDFRNTRIAHQEVELTDPALAKKELLHWVDTLYTLATLS